MIKTRKLILAQYFHLFYGSYLDFTNYPSNVLSNNNKNQGSSIDSVVMSASYLELFLSPSWQWRLKSARHLSDRMALNLSFSDASLGLGWLYAFLAGMSQGDVLLFLVLSDLYQEALMSVCPITVMLTLIIGLRCFLPGFSTVNGFFFPLELMSTWWGAIM